MANQDPFIEADTERSVMGVILDNPERLEELEDIEPEDLAAPDAALVLRAIRALHTAGVRLSTIAVSEWLKDEGKLAAIGGPARLMKMGEMARQLMVYQPVGLQVRRLKDLAVRRRARAVLQQQAESLLDVDSDVSGVLSSAAAKLTECASRGGTQVQRADVVMERSLDRVEAAQKGQGGEKYIRTGVRVWDEFLGGLAIRRLAVLAAHPGVGKSGLIYTMADALADGGEKREPERVFFGHYEDEAESFTDRILAENAGLSLRELGTRGLSTEQLEAIYAARERKVRALSNIFIDDQRKLDVKKVIARARHHVRAHGVRVVMVDHALQLVRDPKKLFEEVWVIMNELADFAHGEKTAAVLLALHLSDPEDKSVDARYVRPTIQMMAGGRTVERVARTIAGMRLCPPPKPPAKPEGMGKAAPRGKSVTEEELQRWQAHQQELEGKWQREWSAHEERKKMAENRVLISGVKSNEGRMGYEFWMERVAHAATFHRDLGGARDGEMGYSPALPGQRARRRDGLPAGPVT